MAGSRIYGSFFSYAGVEYKLYIYDADFVAAAVHPGVMGDPTTGNVWGDPTTGAVWGWDAFDTLTDPPGIQTHELGLPGFSLEYETENEKLYTPLMPSRLTFKLIIENDTQQLFLNAMAESYEGQFLVRILRNDDLFWSGVIMPDVVAYEDMDFPYEFELVAIDGLARLKSIQYSETPTTGGAKETLMAMVMNCLNELETIGFYATGDDFFVDNIDWWETRHVAGWNVDPLVLTRLNNGTWRRLVDSINTVYEYRSCYDVLFQICQAFGARIYHADGKWFMLQPSKYNLSVQPRRVYTKAAVMTYATGGQNYERLCDQNNLARARGGRYEYLAPINKCVVTYSFWGGANYAANTGWDAVMPQDGTDGAQEFDIGEIDNNNGVAVLNFTAGLQHTSDFGTLSFVGVKHKFELEIKIGTKWLSRPSTYTDFNNITYGNYAWSSSAATVEIWTSTVPTQDNQLCTEFAGNNGLQNVGIFITSPPIEVAGDSTINFWWAQTRDSADNIITPSGGTPNVTITWGTSFENLKIWGDGSQFEENAELLYTATNSTTGNSTNVALTSIIGDGPTTAAVSHLETWNGSSWAESELWGAGTGATRNKKLLELLASKIVSIQSTPRQKYVGQLINTTSNVFFDAFHRLQINNKYYVFLGGAFEAVSDTWTNIHLFHIKTELEPETTADVPRS
ncbi:MAG: hypothetical protein IPJ00_17460 [Saprospirales bacterium]|nr:hypothetical protein [Saprospirales bacterium]